MAPPTKLGPMNEKEKAEFDNIRYDDIRECKDVKKLMRLEAYMRAENFPSTADYAEARLRELGQRVANDETDPQLARQLAEERARAGVEIAAWTAKQKEMDASLGAIGREGPSSVSGVAFPPVRNPQRPGDTAAPPPAVKPQQPPSSSASIAKTDSAVGTAVRSGREYYERWEKKAADALLELDRDETSSSRPGAAATAASTAGLARSPELTQRLLDLNRGASPAERLLLSAAEKAKGNEHFRAKEYAEAVERYTLALGLRGTAGEASLFANRAASYIKLRMWDAAEQDASAALEATPAGDMSALKPYIRRAMARLEMGRPAEALVDCDAALRLQPGCAEAVSLRDRAVKVLGDGGMRRMVIEEEDEDAEEGEGEVKTAEPSQQQEGVESTLQKAVANGPSQQQQLPVAPSEVPGVTRRRLVVVEESESDSDEEKEQHQRQASANGNHGAAMSSSAAAAVVPAEEPAAPPSPSSRPSAPVVEQAASTAAAESTPAPPITAASAAAEITLELPMPPAPATIAQPEPQPLPQQAPVTFTAAPAPTPPPCVPPPPPKPQPPGPTPESAFTAAVTAVKDAGNVAFKSGNYREAERRYTEALELAPDWAALYINRCMARTHLGDGHGALRDAADATALDPDNVKALHKRARAKALLRLWQMSCEDLRLCLELIGPQDRSRADVTRELTAMEGKVAEAEARRAAREAAAAARPQRITQYARARVTIEEHDEPEAESADEAPLLAPEEAELQEATALSRLAKLRQVAEERRQHWLAKADQSAAAEYRILLRDWEETAAAAAAAASAAAAAAQVAAAVQAAAALPDKEVSESRAPLASSDPAVAQPDPRAQPPAAQAPQAAPPAQVRAQQAPPPSPQKPGDIAAQVEAIKNEGNEHYRAKRFMEAELCYLRCLDLDPNSIPVHLNLLATMNETGRYVAAEQQAEKVLQLLAVSGTALTSEQATNMRSKVFHRRATARRALGRLAEAQEDLRAARALLGQSPVLDGELESLGRQMAAEREAAEAAAAASAVGGGAAGGVKEQGREQRGSTMEEEAVAPVVVVATATAPEAALGALRRSAEGAMKSTDLSTESVSSVAESASGSKGEAAVAEAVEQRREVSRVASAPAGSTVESTVAAELPSHTASVPTPLRAPAAAAVAATSNGGSGSSSGDGRAPPAAPARRKMVVVEVDDESDEEEEQKKKVEGKAAAAPAVSATPAEARERGADAAASKKGSTTSSSSNSTTTAPTASPACASSSELPPPPPATATANTTTPSPPVTPAPTPTPTLSNTTSSACTSTGDVAEATRLRNEGNRLFGVGNYARAGQLYDASIAVCAHNPAAYCNRSLVRLYLKRPAEALKDAELAIEQAPADYPKARLRKAMALGDLGRPSEALEVLQPLLDANPGDPQLMECLEKWKAAVEETKGSSAKVVASDGKQQEPVTATAASAAQVPASQPPLQPTAAATITVANGNSNVDKAPSANGTGPPFKPVIGQQTAAAARGTANDKTSPSPSSTSLPSTPQPPAPPLEQVKSATSSPPSPPAVPPPTAPTVVRSSSSTLHETACAKAAAALASKAPKKPKPPKNAHELEQALKSLSGHTEVLHEYVRSLDPTTYASVIKANLSTKMITAFVETARAVLGLGTTAGAAANGAAGKRPGVADGAAVEYVVRSLEGLTMVPRFDMTFGLCGKGLKEEVRGIAAVLAASGQDVSLLQKSYKL